MTPYQNERMRAWIRRAGLEPEDLNVHLVHDRAAELYESGCSAAESISRAIGVDMTLDGYKGPTLYQNPPAPDPSTIPIIFMALCVERGRQMSILTTTPAGYPAYGGPCTGEYAARDERRRLLGVLECRARMLAGQTELRFPLFICSKEGRKYGCAPLCLDCFAHLSDPSVCEECHAPTGAGDAVKLAWNQRDGDKLQAAIREENARLGLFSFQELQ
jgi:hypothetical protein